MVEVQDAIVNVLAVAFVIVIEPVASVNVSAGPLAEVDNTTCELLIILRTKYKPPASMLPMSVAEKSVLLAKTTASDTTNALKLEHVNEYVEAELVVHCTEY